MHILNLYEHFGLGLKINILCKNLNSHNSGVKNYSTMNKDKFICNKEQVLQNYVDQARHLLDSRKSKKPQINMTFGNPAKMVLKLFRHPHIKEI